MKKILLLLVILFTVSVANAQSLKSGIESLQTKNSQLASSTSETEAIIDNLSVYPNPVVDMLRVSFKSSRKSLAVISLFNNIGKQVYTRQSEVEPGNNIILIDTRTKVIEPGIYFIQCVAENEVYTRKLIMK